MKQHQQKSWLRLNHFLYYQKRFFYLLQNVQSFARIIQQVAAKFGIVVSLVHPVDPVYPKERCQIFAENFPSFVKPSWRFLYASGSSRSFLAVPGYIMDSLEALYPFTPVYRPKTWHGVPRVALTFNICNTKKVYIFYTRIDLPIIWYTQFFPLSALP